MCEPGLHNGWTSQALLSVQRFFGNRDQQSGLPFRQGQLSQFTQRRVERMSRVFNEYGQETRAPWQQMPGQKLVALCFATVLGKPCRQHQQRSEMIFRLILLHLKGDMVFTHPLTQREGRIAKQH